MAVCLMTKVYLSALSVTIALLACVKALFFLSSSRCVYSDRSWESGDVGWILWLLWRCSGISMPTGFSKYKCIQTQET